MNGFVKALALGWHIWDVQDAWRHDARLERRVVAVIGLGWSLGFGIHAALSAMRRA